MAKTTKNPQNKAIIFSGGNHMTKRNKLILQSINKIIRSLSNPWFNEYMIAYTEDNVAMILVDTYKVRPIDEEWVLENKIQKYINITAIVTYYSIHLNNARVITLKSKINSKEHKLRYIRKQPHHDNLMLSLIN